MMNNPRFHHSVSGCAAVFTRNIFLVTADYQHNHKCTTTSACLDLYCLHFTATDVGAQTTYSNRKRT